MTRPEQSTLRDEIARLADWHAQRIAIADSSRWTADDWEDFADATQRRLRDTLAKASVDPMYDKAVEFTRTRVGFKRERFQRVMQVGFIKRDVLLHQMEDAGVIRRASNDPDYFLVVANNGGER